MKISRTYTLDMEICEQLEKEKNASGLINNLLKDYFITGGMEEIEIEERLMNNKIDLSKLENEREQLKKRLAEIKKKQEYLKETFKLIPDEILQDFRDFPKMTKESLKNRYNDIYKRKYKTSFEDILKSFEEYIKE
jgi:G3E family GTPase